LVCFTGDAERTYEDLITRAQNFSDGLEQMIVHHTLDVVQEKLIKVACNLALS
jgi:hypothetical protein